MEYVAVREAAGCRSGRDKILKRPRDTWWEHDVAGDTSAQVHGVGRLDFCHCAIAQAQDLLE